MVFLNDDDKILHYGTPRRSGRYPWGSGGHSAQRTGDFLSRVKELQEKGLSNTEIAKAFEMKTPEFRAQMSEARYERRILEYHHARSLKDDGLSDAKIAEQMGYNNASSIRSILNEGAKIKMSQARTTANFIKDKIEEKGMIDVGTGVEKELGISKEKLNQALFILKQEGYPTYTGAVKQANNSDRQTILKVVGPKDMEHKDIYNYDKINSLNDYKSFDDGKSFKPKFSYPSSLDIDRVHVRYSEDGGTSRDGLIELRRGVDDISLGESKYAQVRILVDGDRYMKGMAIYSDNLPDGVDMVFNTNKSKSTPKRDVFKAITDDPNNPFGALIKDNTQRYYTDPKTGKEMLSPINKTREEGDWDKWSKKLPSQFLSKQDVKLINKQLDVTLADKRSELEEIMSLTNPVVKKHYLQEFADASDKASVDLKANAFPGQKYKVLIPIPSIKDGQIYDPSLKNGDKVALVRFPHGGIFEIPILTVNNKNKEAISYLTSTPKDAVGINSKAAEQMSGADFDGDFVIRIPITDKFKINAKQPLKQLENFDPKMEYAERPGMKYMKNPKTKTDATQTEMGKISNLITDMTIRGADDDEIARAVKHSMVVIDAAKHNLDYKRSEIDNDIKTLKKKYQGYVDVETGAEKSGASTLISRAKSEVSVQRYKGNPNIDPETGKLSYTEAFTPNQSVKEVDYTYDKKTGQMKLRNTKSTQLAETDDAYKLSSGSPQENAYAEFSNHLKGMANTARKEMVAIPTQKVNTEAKKTYAEEVASLKAKLDVALTNAPKERMAQILTNSEIKAKKQDNPDMTPSSLRKATQQALTKYRDQVGASRQLIDITPKEWEAIQANAVSDNVLTKILSNSDPDILRGYATPRDTNSISDIKQAKIKLMADMGYTLAEIATSVGVTPSTVANYA